MTDDERILDTTAEQVVGVVERMVGLPWPDDDETLPWELDGLEGETLWLAHVLPLASRAEQAETAALVEPLLLLADGRWGARHRFDATRFTDDASTDPASYDRRSALAGMVRALGADDATWWRHRRHAVVLVDSSHRLEDDRRLAVLVLEADWLGSSGDEEAALASPLVADLLSGEKGRVISAAWAVLATRDPDVLGPLVVARTAVERATADLDLGGALMSNASHLRHALHRVELFADGDCLCLAYPDHQRYDVEKEVERGHVRVVETLPNERQWVPDRVCVCRACGRRYQVEEGEYHYTWWAWRPVSGLSPAQATEREAIPVTTTPDDLALWRSRQKAGESNPWSESVRLLDDGERPSLLDHGYLSDDARANPDVMANVQAIDETAALITWVAEDEDEPQAWGYWRGPDDVLADRAPLVSYDSEGQFRLQPGANLTETFCSEYGQWSDEGYEGLAAACREQGVAVAEEDPISLPNPEVSPTPAAYHRAAYDRLLAEGAG